MDMPTARDLMTEGAACATTDQTVSEAARRMRDLGVGALPICDIVVNCVAEGHDVTETTVAGYVTGKPVTIGADDDVAEALRTMVDHDVRRLPVIDGHDLVGMLAQADIARALPPQQVGELVGAISEPG